MRGHTLRRMRKMLALALVVLPSLVIAGKGASSCQPTVASGWVRMAPGMPMGAGFAVLRNACSQPVEVVGAASPDFGDVSLHETRVERGVSRMREVERVPVKANGTVELKPGGLHVMLMAPRRSVAPGGRVRVEFLLADGRRVGADLPVRTTAP